VRHVAADVRDLAAVKALVGRESYDSVVNWIGFAPEHLAGHAELFAAQAGQYVFISTCSVFGYARNKVACEVLLEAAQREAGLPLTIVRPFHTYDRTVVPVLPGWTAIARMRAGKPVVVHGDGTSLWSLTHASDFARAFVPLLGNGHAIGESVNVLSGDILSWDQIHTLLAAAAGVREPRLVHRASETIGVAYPGWAEVLEHDFRHTMLFDTTKLRRLVPGFAPRVSFSAGAREVLAWYDAHPELQVVNAELEAAFDRLLARG
jgi:nucleoside-diphosphate-sugar epimerase